ncbi:sensor histidine kinase [Marinobacter sp. SS21]|uniref:sensor histidine kinase n=1 Tax=Marinobacter sp. SS21 TaxID=2979460 RepID=UPI0023301CBD|nr:PAS domain-containing sensor histidine kinase [Marinobacter sp. SS21]MDC0663654.1 PAS domain-containing sensor histidine kinase [Marinobacter sp. SS21]
MSDEHYLKQELNALLKSDNRIFEFIQHGSLDGLWYWDLENPEQEWMSERFWTTLGFDPQEKLHLASEWQDLINQEDLALALDNFSKHCEDPNHPYDQIVRYRHKDGSTVWVRCRGLAIRDNQGQPVRMLGAHSNVTQIMQLSEQYESLFENSPNSLLVINQRGNLVKVNGKARVHLQLPADVSALDIRQLMGNASAQCALDTLRQTHEVDDPATLETQSDLTMTTLGGARLDMQVNMKPIKFESQWMLLMSLVDLTMRKQVEASKDNLISLINHELRTPLTAIVGAIGLVSSERYGALPEDVSKLLQMANRNCDKLRKLVDDILSVDKLASTNVPLTKSETDLGQIIQDTVAEIQGFADSRAVTLAFHQHSHPAQVYADGFRLGQVITNLLSNAIKHSPQNGQITITLARDGDHFRVGVEDNGPGVSERFRPKLFERFSQDDLQPTDTISGSGLGLHICKLIMDRHHGTINHRNTGHGSLFEFSLPIGEAH